MNRTATVPLLAGCASSPKGGSGSAPAATAQERALARYDAYAGTPVQSFTWLGHFDSWEALGKDRLAVYTTPTEAYLLKIAPPCDLRFVINAVGITSTGATVDKGLDSTLPVARPASSPVVLGVARFFSGRLSDSRAPAA